MKKRFIMLAADVIFSVSIMLSVWFFNYLIPHDGVQAHSEILTNVSDWREKFADKFPETVIVTESSYKSPNISIEVTKEKLTTDKFDLSGSGKHKEYGTKIAYTIADIYIGDISCLQTAFAEDMFGIGYSEKLTDISRRIGSILGVNGDSYNNNRHKNNGIIIRNGTVYRNAPTDVETCVLNCDGTIKIYPPDMINEKDLMENGAYQSWIFGPSLLDENGKAKTDFLTWDYIKQSHPRTAIGYYEPGHYCLLVVDGRQKNYSRGMFLDEMAKLFEDLGCKAAYNLDGGHCSFMTFGENMESHPYKPEHKIPDGIFILDK